MPKALNIDQDEFTRLVHEDKTNAQIAEHFGCSEKTVQARVRKWSLQGIRRHGVRPEPSDLELERDSLRSINAELVEALEAILDTNRPWTVGPHWDRAKDLIKRARGGGDDS